MIFCIIKFEVIIYNKCKKNIQMLTLTIKYRFLMKIFLCAGYNLKNIRYLNISVLDFNAFRENQCIMGEWNNKEVDNILIFYNFSYKLIEKYFYSKIYFYIRKHSQIIKYLFYQRSNFNNFPYFGPFI